MFEESIRMFNVYRGLTFEKSEAIPAYVAELGNRISQLKYLHDRALFYSQKINNDPFAIQAIEDMKILEIYCESFYHFAWRIIEITRTSKKLVRIEKIGIHEVRNRLIQHPEKDKRQKKEKSYPSFSAGGFEGPKIKGYIGPDGSYDDKGFLANAREFETNLNLVLEKLIDILSQP